MYIYNNDMFTIALHIDACNSNLPLRVWSEIILAALFLGFVVVHRQFGSCFHHSVKPAPLALANAKHDNVTHWERVKVVNREKKQVNAMDKRSHLNYEDGRYLTKSADGD